MHAVHFGAGNIGKGFIGDLLRDSGYDLTFIDVSDALIAEINKTHSYDLYLIDHDNQKKVVDNVKALSSLKQEAEVIEAIVDADIITTSVWANNLPKIAPTLARGLKARLAAGRQKVNVLACENAMFATDLLKKSMAECGAITAAELDQIGCYPNTAVDRVVLGTQKDGRQAVNIADYHELAIEKNRLVDCGSTPIQGAKYTENLRKYLERKLYVINCGHAWAGYIGYINGFRSVRDVFLTPTLVEEVRRAMLESAKLMCAKYDFTEEEMRAYVDFGIRRYQAAGVDYSVQMVTRSPIRKLGESDRLTGPCVQCEAKGFANESLLKGIALVFLLDRDDDEEAVRLQRCIRARGIAAAVEEFTGISLGSRMHRHILAHYREQKVLRDERRNKVSK